MLPKIICVHPANILFLSKVVSLLTGLKASCVFSSSIRQCKDTAFFINRITFFKTFIIIF